METQHLKSLEIIEEMVKKSKERYSDSGFLYLLWGYLVIIAALINFVLLKMDYSYSFIGWAVLMPLGGVISGIYSARENKKHYVKTYTDDVMKYTWLAFGILLITILVFMGKLQLNTYPLIMVAYGVPTFISGGVLKFKPLIYGALGSVVMGIISFFYPFDVQLIMLSFSILMAYLIPGHLLRNQYLRLKN